MVHDCDSCKYVLVKEDEEPCVHCTNNYEHRDMWEPVEDKVVLERRCKTCLYFYGDKAPGDIRDGVCVRDGLDFEVNENDYCSFSEGIDGTKD